MSITQEHILAVHRARQRGEYAPPAPGVHERQVVEAWRERRRFRAALAGRPARGRLRRALARRLRRTGTRALPVRPRSTC
ncbi:hypothetical protein [Streptomyces poriticola]|uniref:hypothetical protein n=1 Tax=Streptomyces poriticola TaxID=3120506 RepID=UPI002FCE1F62